MGRQDESTLQSRQATMGDDAVFRTWGLTIAWHPDLRRVGERAVLAELAEPARSAELSRLTPRFAGALAQARPLEDRRLSRQGFWLRLEEEGSIVIERRDSPTSLAIDGEPLGPSRRISAAELEHGATLLLGGGIVLWLHLFDPQLDLRLPRWGMVGDSSAMVGVRRAIARVADLPVPVLVRGETGTGKELVARALHAASPRRDGPFVAVNMAALPAELATAELFGAARGAFTGAVAQRAGYFAEAQGGTLFLDEIGETPEAVQPLLLRALESGEIQPLGGGRRKVDVRIVAATDLDFEAAIRERRFRSPLFHRLRGFEISLPTLASRREDIGRLMVAFLAEELRAVGEEEQLVAPSSWLPAELAQQMLRAPWKGNVRELKAAIRQLVIASRGQGRAVPDQAFKAMLVAEAGDAEVSELLAAAPAALLPKGSEDMPPRRPADIGEDELVAAMRAARYRPQAAAKSLGISRSSMYDLIARSRQLRTAADLDDDTIAAAHAASAGHVESMAAALEVSASALRRRLRQLKIEGPSER